jgi:hypothetical protein
MQEHLSSAPSPSPTIDLDHQLENLEVAPLLALPPENKMEVRWQNPETDPVIVVLEGR